MDALDIDNRFDYHPPQTEERKQDHEQVRTSLKSLAHRLNEIVPDGREKSLAMTHLEEAMFWANAGLARVP